MSGRSGGGRGGGGRGGGYRNPCLTMHQPWASLLVYGIKRIEGRSWPSPLTGRLWIHAAGKVPDADTIKAMEDFYREIYAVNGITDLKFPEHYPTSRLIGCVDIVGCLKCEELVSWEEVPESVRLEGLTNYCWLCENPQRLVVPFEMRGYQGVYNLEKRVFEAARRGLSPVQGPLPVKFPLPDPQNPLSLRPGSLASCHNISKSSTSERPFALTVAIAGARAAATQFSNKGPSSNAIEVPEDVTRKSEKTTSVEEIHSNGYFSDEVKKPTHESRKSHNSSNHLGVSNYAVKDKMGMRKQRCTYREVVKDSDHHPRPSSKLFSSALKELGSSHDSS